jgi:pyruvate/2-oxoglutarate dehydrogenase complex dihydrolipoamide dehydrogenase (E3) component
MNPDGVVVATGSRPKEKPVTGDYGPPQVLNVWETLSGDYPVGERVLFVDENGGHHASATVELLADLGKKVTMVTSDLFIGIELAPLGDLYLTRQRLLQKGVTFMTDVLVDLIAGDKVMGRDHYTHEPLAFEGYQTIVLDMGNLPVDDLYFQLKGKVKELYRVGDCVAPRGIDMAVFEGRRVGERV